MSKGGSDRKRSSRKELERSRARRRFVKAKVEVHDRTQFEIIFDYNLEPGKKDDRWLRYQVDTLLFYPSPLGVSPHTYPKERFYDDIRPLIRLREPRLGFRQLRGLNVKSSPMLFLREYVEALHDGLLPIPLGDAVDEVRILVCSFVSYFLRRTERRRRDILQASRAGNDSDLEQAMERTKKLIVRSQSILRDLRELIHLCEGLPDGFASDLVAELKLADEYCGYRFRDGVASVMRAVPATLETEAATGFFTAVDDVISEERRHAEMHGFLFLGQDADDAQREQFVYRRGALKRRMWAVFFLAVRTKPLFAVQKQIGAMIAAGLAAAWAVAGQVLLVRELAMSERMTDLWGVGGLIFASAAVLFYVVKDRIKEFGRGYFGRGLFRSLPDNSDSIYYRRKSGEQIQIGQIRERVRFIEHRYIPEELLKLRKKRSPSRLDSDNDHEFVMHYKKNIDVRSDIRTHSRYPLRAVHDIMRMNINSCLTRLGEPSVYGFSLESGRNVGRLPLPKNYHLDLIMRHTKIGRFQTVVAEHVDFIRLVLNKDGLIRIDRLS